MYSDSSYETDPFPPPSPTAMMPYRMDSASDNEGYPPPAPGEHRESLQSMSEILQAREQHNVGHKSTKMKMFKAPSFDVRGSFRKMKNKFKRGKDQGALPHAASSHSIEVLESDMEPHMLNLAMAGMPEDESPAASGYATPQPYDHHPGGYDVNPTDTLPRKHTGNTFGTMKSSMKNWLYPPIANDPPNRPSDVAVLKTGPEPSLVRMSNFIYVLLITGAVIGIILLCLSSEGEDYSVLGALFLGFSLFALLGKVFITLFWMEEPCPRLRPYITQVDNVIGGAKDPYRLRESSVQTMPQLQATAAFPLDQYTYRYSMPAETGLPGYDMPDINPAQMPQYPDYTYPSPAYNSGYEPDVPQQDYYGEKPPMHLDEEETVDTKMRDGRSVEAIAAEYDDPVDLRGNVGPAAFL